MKLLSRQSPRPNNFHFFRKKNNRYKNWSLSYYFPVLFLWKVSSIDPNMLRFVETLSADAFLHCQLLHQLMSQQPCPLLFLIICWLTFTHTSHFFWPSNLIYFNLCLLVIVRNFCCKMSNYSCPNGNKLSKIQEINQKNLWRKKLLWCKLN